ncbi:MAG: hypothetical protein E6Q43_05315 [Dokdonella sp.]|nr:MAG: hypothetical protein E6Q43_05315 [Dokdonella sp.]
MGMTAFVVFTSCGAAAGTAAGIRAIRHDGHGPRAVAYWSLSAVVLGAFMTLQWVFWASLAPIDLNKALLPDFFSPGRKERIFWCYALTSAGIGGLSSAAWAWLGTRWRQ